jgi:hypothetical protein
VVIGHYPPLRYIDYRDSRMLRVLGKTDIDLDSRESAVRFGEVGWAERMEARHKCTARSLAHAFNRVLCSPAVPFRESYYRCSGGGVERYLHSTQFSASAVCSYHRGGVYQRGHGKASRIAHVHAPPLSSESLCDCMSLFHERSDHSGLQ